MSDEELIYHVWMCKRTGCECIWCPGPGGDCEHRHTQMRARPWHGEPRCAHELWEAGAVPDEDLSPHKAGAGQDGWHQGFLYQSYTGAVKLG